MRSHDHAVVPGGRDTVGVLEVDPTGHRLQYVRHLYDAAGPGRCIVLVPAEVRASEEFATHLGGDVGTASVGRSADRSGTLAPAVDEALRRGLTRLVVPEADGYLVALLVLLLRRPRLPLEFRLLLMRTASPRGAGTWRPALVAKPVLVWLLRRFPQVGVHFLTDAFGVVERRPGFPGVTGVRDPVVVPARVAAGGGGRGVPAWIPPRGPDTLLVGMFGVISPRKNLALLVAAARQVPHVVVVVGGQVGDEVAAHLLHDDDALVLRDAGRLVVEDRMLDADEFGAALAAVDVVAVLHDNDAPSGIVAEACVRGTPAIVPRGGWLARVVEATGVGRTADLTLPGVVSALGSVAPGEPATGGRSHRLGTEDFTTTLLARP